MPSIPAPLSNTCTPPSALTFPRAPLLNQLSFVACACGVVQLLLTLAIGATMLGGYMYYRFENTLSFEYTGVDDEKKAAETLAGEFEATRASPGCVFLSNV